MDEILVRKLDARYVVCGFNYHFGHQGLGTSELLWTCAPQRGIQVEIVQPVSYQGEVVSSSHIRELIMEGRMEEASTLLGHPFTIQTKVIGGQKLARKLGFPTINQQFSPENIVPAHGVYVTIVEIRGKPYRG